MSDREDYGKAGTFAKLKGTTNYHEWSKCMELYLRQKDVWEVVASDKVMEKPIKPGPNPAPTDAALEAYKAKKKKWQKLKDKKSKAAYFIYTGVALEHQPIVEEEFENPHKMWTLLRENFTQLTAGRGLSPESIRERLNRMSYDFGDDIDVFCSTFTKEAHSLKLACGPATDVNGELLSKLMEAMPDDNPQVLALKTIVRQQLRNRRDGDPIITWTKVLEEFRSEVLDALRKKDKIEALVAKTQTSKSGNNDKKGQGRKFCTHCKFPGHRVDECFRKDPSKKAAYDKKRKEADAEAKKRSRSDSTSTNSGNSKRNKMPTVLGEEDEACMATVVPEEEEVLLVNNPTDRSFNKVYGDSGTTSNMFCNKRYFVEFRKLNQKMLVKVGNGEKVPVVCEGDVLLRLWIRKPGQKPYKKAVILKNVLYVPGLMANLISIRALADLGIGTNFLPRTDKGPLRSEFNKNGKTLMTATLQNNQYCIDLAPKSTSIATNIAEIEEDEIEDEAFLTKNQPFAADDEESDSESEEEMDDNDWCPASQDITVGDEALSNEIEDIQTPEVKTVTATQFQTIWHHRLGHPNQEVMKQLSTHSDIKDKEHLRTCRLDKHSCISCAEGKSQRMPRTTKTRDSKGDRRAANLLEIVHCDTTGKINPPSYPKKFNYFQLYIDESTSYVTIACLRRKAKGLSKFQTYKRLAENQSGQKIKRFKTDNGTEFVSKKSEQLYAKEGVIHEVSPPYNPKMNGKPERYMKTITTRGTCLMFTAGAPSYLWDHAIVYATQITDVLPTKSNPDNKSPFEMVNGRLPCLKYFRVWGCNAMVHVPKEKRSKLDKKATKAAFVGLEDFESGIYKLWDPKTKKIIKSADVTFDEANFDIISSRSGVEPNGIQYFRKETNGPCSSE